MDSLRKRLKIAVLHRTFCASAGGAEAYAVAVALDLSQRHEVHVFAQTIDTSFQTVTFHPVALFFKRPRWLNQLWYATATWWLTREGFDIVHSHENTWHGNIQTVHVIPMRCKNSADGLWRKLKFLTSPRLWTYAALEFFRFRVNSKRLWVAVSSPLLQQLQQMRPPLPAGQLFSIAPGIYPRTNEDCGKTQKPHFFTDTTANSKILLWVGNDAVKKNLQTVLNTLSVLDSSYKLLVVGKALPLTHWQEQLEALGIADRVKFLGVVSVMSEIYASVDLLLHPSLEDTFGMVVLEAMSFGLPVVVSSSEHCGIAADLQHGLNAFILVDPKDAIALKSAVLELSQPPVLAKYQANSVAFANNCLWPHVAAQYEVLYQQVLSA
ncbi:MAG: glycosyltransferase family 4 protein [Burkholderiales bacterium]|nr:glycosyltransferase family 4 protein [Burkholderiales bacterium]